MRHLRPQTIKNIHYMRHVIIQDSKTRIDYLLHVIIQNSRNHANIHVLSEDHELDASFASSKYHA